jgi:hypothetical protein
MKTPIKALFPTILLVLTTSAAAFDFSPASHHEEHCYAQAMIGLDSVINARLGVPAEHALYLAVLNRSAAAAPTITVYSRSMLNTIWDAYFWQETPHSYAIKVFYRCATEQTAPRGIRNDWIIAENY